MSNSVAGKLIRIIKKYPVLYDPSNADYRTKEVVEPLWQEIALELNDDYMELRKRWRNLRDTYVKLLRLVKKSENDEVFRAAAIRKFYTWIWAKEMEFFRPYLTIGNNLGEVDVSIPGQDGIIVKEKSKEKPNKRPSREAALKAKKLNTEISATSPQTVSPLRKVKKELTKEVHSTRVLRPKKSQNMHAQPSVSNQTEIDATDRLFLAHSQNIKQFSARRQAITKLKIAEVIMQQEILDQEEKDLASASFFHSNSANKQEIKELQDDDIMPFETVCGYDTDEAVEDEIPYVVSDCKKESFDDDPVEDDDDDF